MLAKLTKEVDKYFFIPNEQFWYRNTQTDMQSL